MASLIRSAIDRAKLHRLLRRQNSSLELRQWFRDSHDIDVGLYSYGCFDRWRMPGPLRIGRYCSFAKTARVVDANHPLEALTTHPLLYEKQFGVVPENRLHSEPLFVGDDVWVGHHAIIMPGCKKIGRGAVIGAGSIVTRDIDPYTVVAGVPAHPLRKRFSDELIEAIEASRWWECEPAELRDIYAKHPDALDAPTPELLAAAFGARTP